MPEREPTTELHQQFSSDGATATPWPEARGRLETAEVDCLATVRPNGRPHVTPMVAVWMDGALHYSTGSTEGEASSFYQSARSTTSIWRKPPCNSVEWVL